MVRHRVSDGWDTRLGNQPWSASTSGRRWYEAWAGKQASRQIAAATEPPVGRIGVSPVFSG